MAISEKYIDLGIKVGFVAAGVLLWQKIARSSQKSGATKDILTNSNAALADRLYSLLHPFGGSLLSFMENVDEDAVLEWAKTPMDFNKVREYYRKLTKGKELLDDVKFPLTSSEYKKFISYIRKNNALKVNAVAKKVFAMKAGIINKSFAVIAIKDPVSGKYKLTDKAKTVFFEDNAEIGVFLAEVPIYLKKHKKNIHYNFVKGTGRLSNEHLFVLKSQSFVK